MFQKDCIDVVLCFFYALVGRELVDESLGEMIVVENRFQLFFGKDVLWSAIARDEGDDEQEKRWDDFFHLRGRIVILAIALSLFG